MDASCYTGRVTTASATRRPDDLRSGALHFGPSVVFTTDPLMIDMVTICGGEIGLNIKDDTVVSIYHRDTPEEKTVLNCRNLSTHTDAADDDSYGFSDLEGAYVEEHIVQWTGSQWESLVQFGNGLVLSVASVYIAVRVGNARIHRHARNCKNHDTLCIYNMLDGV